MSPDDRSEVNSAWNSPAQDDWEQVTETSWPTVVSAIKGEDMDGRQLKTQCP